MNYLGQLGSPCYEALTLGEISSREFSMSSVDMHINQHILMEKPPDAKVDDLAFLILIYIIMKDDFHKIDILTLITSGAHLMTRTEI